MPLNKKPARKKNIADVALAAGVSKSTVSNYLNNRTSLYSFETGIRIRDAISALRYIPDPGARGIKSQEGGKSLGILLRNRIDRAMGMTYFQQVLPGICDTMDEYGYRTLIIPETRNPERDITYIRELSKGLLAGFFIFDIKGENDPYVAALKLDGAKFICIGYNPSVENFVASRHDLGSENAVAHLIRAHRCRRIAIITGASDRNIDLDRLKGYRNALSENGLIFDPSLVIFPGETGPLPATLRKLFKLSLRKRPDALLLSYWELREVESILAEFNLRVPDDVRLILFDSPPDIPDAADRDYAHIVIHAAQVGRTAADRIFKMLKGDPAGFGGMFLDVEFHPGKSCGCP